jgi:Domain of unknown function (DUF4136)
VELPEMKPEFAPRIVNGRIILPLAAALALSACVAPFEARVARFQQLPAPAGNSFVIEPRDKANEGGLEFATYAGLVRQRLIAAGFQEAASADAAAMVVQLDYNVTAPREKVQSRLGVGGGWGGNDVYSVTTYNAVVAMRINRSGDKQSLFEGRAETVSNSNNLTQLVPNLVTAMFTNFPGNSGETVRVRFDPAKPGVAPTVKPVR